MKTARTTKAKAKFKSQTFFELMMTHPENQRMARAIRVLELLTSDMVGGETPIIEAYSNGREQGFHFTLMTSMFRCSFSEDRRSDQMVLYSTHGMENITDFSTANGPNDELYRNKTLFDTPEGLVLEVVKRVQSAQEIETKKRQARVERTLLSLRMGHAP